MTTKRKATRKVTSKKTKKQQDMQKKLLEVSNSINTIVKQMEDSKGWLKDKEKKYSDLISQMRVQK